MELLISGPEGRSRKVALSAQPLSLGRSEDNELAYPEDPWLSRYHLVFERENNHWIVKDCGSRNGTIVNAEHLDHPHRLEPGDHIQAGKLQIEVLEPHQDSVAFVQSDNGMILREAAVVTSLDEVLSQTAQMAAIEKDSGLSSSRAVQALLRAGQELAGLRPLEQLFEVILDLALSAVEAKRGVILTLEGGELRVRASRGGEFTISTSIRDRVLRDRRSLMIEDAQLDRTFNLQHSIIAQRVRSILTVPLQTGSQVIGLIYIDNGDIFAPFSQKDLDLLTVMANVAAIRLEHARLAEIEKQEQLTAFELAQAKEIQKDLLPQAAPSFEGGEVAGYNLPCRAVGGDYYDFLPYHDGRFALVVGDVSGKGLPAALMMSSLQARVQMLVEAQPDPASAMTILNRSQCERCPLGKFITFVYALLDPATGLLYYCNAGHNSPLVLRANGSAELLPGSDIVLGIKADATYNLLQARLEPGDVLALYSDGVTEARDCYEAEFGEDGLAEFMRANRHKSASEMVASLHERICVWTESDLLADDFTVVFVKKY